MKVLPFLFALLILLGCRPRENSSVSSIQPATAPDFAMVTALTPIPNQSIDESYHQAFIWYAESALRDESSLAEVLNKDLECDRHIKALMGLFFLELNSPRGLISDRPGLAQTTQLFKELNTKYSLTYPTIVRHLGESDFVLQSKSSSRPLKTIEDVRLDEFETSLAAMNNEDVDESGTRIPLDSSCADKRVHASRLFNLQVRFPGVLSAAYSVIPGFTRRIKNAQMIMSDLKTIKKD